MLGPLPTFLFNLTTLQGKFAHFTSEKIGVERFFFNYRKLTKHPVGRAGLRRMRPMEGEKEMREGMEVSKKKNERSAR